MYTNFKLQRVKDSILNSNKRWHLSSNDHGGYEWSS